MPKKYKQNSRELINNKRTKVQIYKLSDKWNIITTEVFKS